MFQRGVLQKKKCITKGKRRHCNEREQREVKYINALPLCYSRNSLRAQGKLLLTETRMVGPKKDNLTKRQSWGPKEAKMLFLSTGVHTDLVPELCGTLVCVAHLPFTICFSVIFSVRYSSTSHLRVKISEGQAHLYTPLGLSNYKKS